MKTRIVVPHCKTCLERQRTRPRWYLAGTGIIRRDSLGRRNGDSTRWLRAICVYMDCPAEALIRAADIEAAIPLERKEKDEG